MPGAGAGSELSKALWLWQAVVVGGIVLNILVGVYSISASRRAGKISQHREVSFSKEWIDREEWQATTEELKARIARNEQWLERLTAEFRADREAQGGAIDEKLSRVHERIDDLKDDLAKLPSQMVAMLVNAKLLNTEGGQR